MTFLDVVGGQRTFFYRDFGVFTYPVAQYFRECFWRGELPLWNPLNNCGVPLLAQWNTAVLYPPSLFYLLFPLSWSLGVFNLGHLFFAGLGMYLLARRWTGNPLAAAVAGLAFGFNGLSWHMLMWVSNLAHLGVDAPGVVLRTRCLAARRTQFVRGCRRRRDANVEEIGRAGDHSFLQFGVWLGALWLCQWLRREVLRGERMSAWCWRWARWWRVWPRPNCCRSCDDLPAI